MTRIDEYREALERGRCLNGGISVLSGLRNAEKNLEWVTKGFPLYEVPNCIGSGSGVRFAELRCGVSVEDMDKYRRRTLVSGDVLVKVIGKTNFRWSLIR
jgi:hypothetical protein